MKRFICFLLLVMLACTEKTTKVVFVTKHKHPPNPHGVMPPHPKLKEKMDREGKLLPSTMPGTQKKFKLARPGGQAPATITNYKVLALIVDFTDSHFVKPLSFFDNLIFGANQPSMRHFFQQNSYGQFEVTPVLLPSQIGVIRLPHPINYYADSNNGLGQSFPNNGPGMFLDAVTLANPLVNFADYDNDGDGEVDGVILIHAGTGAEMEGDPETIWSHKWEMPPVTLDGKVIKHYCTVPEFWRSDNTYYHDMTIGVYAHEFTHTLGIIDLYAAFGWGLGRWDLMAQGTWNGPSGVGDNPACLGAWVKQELGFVTPIVITDSLKNAPLPQVYNNPTVYRLWTNGASGQEYFLIENRQKTGYDANLPGHGILVIHIDESEPSQFCGWWPGAGIPSDDCHYKVQIMEADSLYNLERRAAGFTNSGDAGDPFPGTRNNRLFNYTTNPSSRSWFGNADSKVRIQNISNSGAAMTADLFVKGDSVPPPPPPPCDTCGGGEILECSPNITIRVDKNMEGKTVEFSSPMFNGQPAPGAICNPPSGFFFPVGITTVRCVSGPQQLPAVCSFSITVKRKGRPTS